MRSWVLEVKNDRFLYRRWDGQFYRYVAIAKDGDTGERLCVVSDEAGRREALTYDQFFGRIELDGQTVRRFEPVNPIRKIINSESVS